MASPLLTIAVPTHERAQELRRLLLRLASEGCVDDVAIRVSDNASTDETPSVLAESQRRMPTLQYVRQEENCGPDENFARVLTSLDSRYVWLFGDDDLPAAGSLALILELLRSRQPDTVYLSSQWLSVECMHQAEVAPPVDHLQWRQLSSLELARRVHIWTTFISAWIVRADYVAEARLRAFTGTHLIQLGWILPAISEGRHHVWVDTPVVTATGGNSGGYSRLEVFGNSFGRICHEILSSNRRTEKLATSMISRSAVTYLPSQVWETRAHRDFDKIDIRFLNAKTTGGRMWRRLVLFSIARAPRLLARCVLQFTRVASATLCRLDQLREDGLAYAPSNSTTNGVDAGGRQTSPRRRQQQNR